MRVVARQLPSTGLKGVRLSVITDLRVPSPAIPILRKFTELTDEQANEVIMALQSLSLTVSTNLLSVTVDNALPHFSKDETDEFIGVIFSLLSISLSHNWKVDDVAQTIAEYGPLNVPGELQETFARHLAVVLSIPTIADVANAADVATEYDSLYHVARCHTDIRPVFSGTVEPRLSGAVIVHNLKFDYSANGDIESFTIALTGADVEELQRVLADAVTKSRELQTFLKSSNLRVFNFGGISEGN